MTVKAFVGASWSIGSQSSPIHHSAVLPVKALKSDYRSCLSFLKKFAVKAILSQLYSSEASIHSPFDDYYCWGGGSKGGEGGRSGRRNVPWIRLVEI